MATVIWIGKQQIVRQVTTITIGGTPPSSATTLTVTAGGNATESYTAATSEALATIAAAILAKLLASINGEFRELTYAAGSTTTITVTGPSDGAPFTLAVSGSANGVTISSSTTTSPKSPHDLNDAVNYSGGALPTTSDILVFENGSVDVRYNLDQLGSVALGGFIRRNTYTGRIGLPDIGGAGYRQYRPVAITAKSPTYVIAQAATDSPQQIRIIDNYTAGTATLTIDGVGGAGQVMAEAVEVNLNGQTANFAITGASVLINPNQTHTGTVNTLTVSNGSLRTGQALAATAAATWYVINSDVMINGQFDSLRVDGQSTVIAQVSAEGTGTAPCVVIDGGTVTWRSAATPKGLTIGSNGSFVLSDAPGLVTIGNVFLNAGAQFLDPYNRAATGFDISLVRCNLNEVGLDFGTHRKLTIANAA